MNLPTLVRRAAQYEPVNFVLTNHVPRAVLTRFMAWFSRIEQPQVRRLSIATWRAFADLDLSDAKKREFVSLHDCFTRELATGARTIDRDPDVIASPCDGIVGMSGTIDSRRAFQAKGSSYDLAHLLEDAEFARTFEGGTYATLRLTSGMYHRFHAPYDGQVGQTTYVAGDTWNVNPVALKRIESLYCKNERAIIRYATPISDSPLALVAVGAILVASIRLHYADTTLNARYRGPRRLISDARFGKGDELGWFEHGSTILLLAPPGVVLDEGVRYGVRVRTGEALMRVVWGG